MRRGGHRQSGEKDEHRRTTAQLIHERPPPPSTTRRIVFMCEQMIVIPTLMVALAACQGTVSHARSPAAWIGTGRGSEARGRDEKARVDGPLPFKAVVPIVRATASAWPLCSMIASPGRALALALRHYPVVEPGRGMKPMMVRVKAPSTMISSPLM
jgi:hypothetical protein